MLLEHITGFGEAAHWAYFLPVGCYFMGRDPIVVFSFLRESREGTSKYPSLPRPLRLATPLLALTRISPLESKDQGVTWSHLLWLNPTEKGVLLPLLLFFLPLPPIFLFLSSLSPQQSPSVAVGCGSEAGRGTNGKEAKYHRLL